MDMDMGQVGRRRIDQRLERAIAHQDEVDAAVLQALHGLEGRLQAPVVGERALVEGDEAVLWNAKSDAEAVGRLSVRGRLGLGNVAHEMDLRKAMVGIALAVGGRDGWAHRDDRLRLADHAPLQPAHQSAFDGRLGVALRLKLMAVVDEPESGIQPLGAPSEDEGLDVVAMPRVDGAPAPHHPQGELGHLEHAEDRAPWQGRGGDAGAHDVPFPPPLFHR